MGTYNGKIHQLSITGNNEGFRLIMKTVKVREFEQSCFSYFGFEIR